MWPISVDFRSVSSEIKRRKKEERKKEERKKKNPGNIEVRRHTMSGGLIKSKQRQATNTSTTNDYPNVIYALLPYNMESATLTIESNSKRRYCHLMHCKNVAISSATSISVKEYWNFDNSTTLLANFDRIFTVLEHEPTTHRLPVETLTAHWYDDHDFLEKGQETIICQR